ncbi:hypothetical protein AAMO2058_000829500 [Amorphochlora amoebiformis]
MYKSSLEIYRDLCRLVNHIGARTPKGVAIMDTVRTKFKENRYESDLEKIQEMQEDARRALSNYLVSDSLMKMRRRKGVKGDINYGTQPEEQSIQHALESLDEKIKDTFEAYDAEEAGDPRYTRRATDVLEWAEEGDEEEPVERIIIHKPGTLPNTLQEFSAKYEPRDPEEGFVVRFFTIDPEEKRRWNEEKAREAMEESAMLNAEENTQDEKKEKIVDV